jgi:hypothetical protein
MDLLEKLDPELLEQLKSVTVIKSDDRVVFHFDVDLTRDQADEIRERIKYSLGHDLRFLVTSKGIGTFVIRAES